MTNQNNQVGDNQLPKKTNSEPTPERGVTDTKHPESWDESMEKSDPSDDMYSFEEEE